MKLEEMKQMSWYLHKRPDLGIVTINPEESHRRRSSVPRSVVNKIHPLTRRSIAKKTRVEIVAYLLIESEEDPRNIPK